MPWCICVLYGVCSAAVKRVALRPVFGGALVHLRAAWCVQSGPVVSVAQRPTFSDALVHLCSTACAVALEGQSGSDAADAQVHLCMACHVQRGSEASEL
jgi:hypothetical protein